MKILSCQLQNFASYKELEFDFENQGLTLVQGATGSGKSTLCDAIPWILFGKTAKNGTVDEVLSWPGGEVTYGRVLLAKDSITINITRIRGKSKGNDLYFSLSAGQVTRGKDLQDTQRLINNLIGVNCELYLSGAYFHEFSQTAQFFNTTAKNRRTICEQIVDLSLATKLCANISGHKKEVVKGVETARQEIAALSSNIQLLERIQIDEKTKAERWEQEHTKTKNYIATCYDKFESSRKKIISKKCNSCGTVLEQPKEIIDNSTNPHLSRLAELETEINPHTGGVKDFTKEISNKNAELRALKNLSDMTNMQLSDLDLLNDVVADFRGTIVKNALLYVETTTNKLLTEHFDAEIRIEMSIEDSDKVEVNILKDGNNCSYTQLSKGQRQLLKLCFGVSVMKCVSNNSGIKFEQVFFDESLDGMDDNMKSKSFKLLEELSLEYASVFVVEHSEGFKSLFNNQYHVELVNGKSQIEKTV